MESTYTFAEGDVVKWTNAYPAVEVWDEGTHLKFTTPLNLQLDIKDGTTSGIYAATSNYDTPARLTAQDVNITGQSTGSNYDINRIYISGIETYAADIKIKNLNIDITADGKPESIADGIFMGRDPEDEDSEHTLTVTGAANIKAVSKNGSYAWAAGIEAQDQAKMNFGKLTIATEAMAENLARTNGIFAAGNSEINAGETHINVKGISPNPDESSYSYGLNAIHSSTITLGDNSTIHAESSGDGAVMTVGVRAGYYSEVNLGITDIRAENNSAEGTVDVLFVEDGSVLNMAGGSITGANNANNGLFNAINAYGEDPDPTWHTDTIVNINKDTTNGVVIVGDVHAANTAIVNLNLNTDASSITGNLDQSGPYVDKDDSAGTINLTLANKATWHAMGEYGIGYSYLEKLTLNDGSITMTNEEVQNIDINHLQGTGGELTLVKGSQENVRALCLRMYREAVAAGRSARILAFEEHLSDYAGAQALSIGSLERPETVAHQLFRVLRQMDEEGVEALTCEVLPAEGIGLAIMNRLSRAAAFRIRNADEEADLQAAPIAEADG